MALTTRRAHAIAAVFGKVGMNQDRTRFGKIRNIS
jgi:hypothetical protein